MPLVANKTESNTFNTQNPHTHNKRQHKSEIKIFFLLLGWRLTLARSCVVRKKLIKGFIAQLNEKELRELADYSNGAAAIARAEKKSRIVESMRNLFNEFVGLIGFSQYDSQKD